MIQAFRWLFYVLIAGAVVGALIATRSCPQQDVNGMPDGMVSGEDDD
jgi:hypothetical protein